MVKGESQKTLYMLDQTTHLYCTESMHMPVNSPFHCHSFSCLIWVPPAVELIGEEKAEDMAFTVRVHCVPHHVNRGCQAYTEIRLALSQDNRSFTVLQRYVPLASRPAAWPSQKFPKSDNSTTNSSILELSSSFCQPTNRIVGRMTANQ